MGRGVVEVVKRDFYVRFVGECSCSYEPDYERRSLADSSRVAEASRTLGFARNGVEVLKEARNLVTRVDAEVVEVEVVKLELEVVFRAGVEVELEPKVPRVDSTSLASQDIGVL